MRGWVVGCVDKWQSVRVGERLGFPIGTPNRSSARLQFFSLDVGYSGRTDCIHPLSSFELFLFGVISSQLFAMFDDMDWDMEAAADQEEDCVFGSPAEEEHCFGLPPADPPETAWLEDPHDLIASSHAEKEGPSDVQNEPAPVQLPIVETTPEKSERRRLNSKQASELD